MSEEIQLMRAMYYPSLKLQVKTTANGLLETTPSDLYEHPLSGRTIWKVDMLYKLEPQFGTLATHGRKYLYTILCGEGVYSKEYNTTLATAYRRHAAFANFIDNIYYFGDDSVELGERIQKAFRELIVDIRDKTFTGWGRLLMENQGYLYIGYDNSQAPLSIDGGVSIHA